MATQWLRVSADACLRVWTPSTFHDVAKVAVVCAVIEQAEPGRRHRGTLRHFAWQIKAAVCSDPLQWAPNLSRMRLSHLYVAAGSHGRGDYGEVNCLHLANCWSMIGLNIGWSDWAELGEKTKAWGSRRPPKCIQSPLGKLLTLYDPMAFICDTMAVWTWGHGTPTNLHTDVENDRKLGLKHLICYLSRRGWTLTRQSCSRPALCQLVCCLKWCTVPKTGRRTLP